MGSVIQALMDEWINMVWAGEWSGSLDAADRDNYWIDAFTGERVLRANRRAQGADEYCRLYHELLLAP